MSDLHYEFAILNMPFISIWYCLHMVVTQWIESSPRFSLRAGLDEIIKPEYLWCWVQGWWSTKAQWLDPIVYTPRLSRLRVPDCCLSFSLVKSPTIIRSREKELYNWCTVTACRLFAASIFSPVNDSSRLSKSDRRSSVITFSAISSVVLDDFFGCFDPYIALMKMD